jgi:hypothetical protein
MAGILPQIPACSRKIDDPKFLENPRLLVEANHSVALPRRWNDGVLHPYFAKLQKGDL